MNKIAIVAQREYLTRIKKRSFFIITLIMPLLFVALVAGGAYIETINKDDVPTQESVRMVTPENIEEIQSYLNSDNTPEDNIGKPNAVSAMMGYCFSFLMYMFVFAYGVMVMSGVMEEKTNRIIEVMVSSVKPFDLMMGKLVGIGLVGLTQFGIWIFVFTAFAITGTIVFAGAEVVTQILTMFLTIDTLVMSVLFLIFFIGGFLIYASLYAAIGAMVSSQEDSQQYTTPITLFLLFSFYIGIYTTKEPESALAFWASIIPFTSPIVMITRLPYNNVAWWELLLSIIILVITVILIIKLTAKIYRVGILMYGKKPSLKEIIRWIKQS
ncbi:ABC-type Na+ efflux pump permease subunit [Dysgonomonadaceae bacterium PH5-43]|nr:ABC-type Na+ efflux pump permease subunit [Dysgonomonadaceae bacterium PH5-43]